MKAVILAGGFGSRISEESHLKPKPMIEIGGMPILWHIMKTYSHYGIKEFIICAGYKQHVIKEYFADYFLHMSDVTFDFSDGNKMIIHQNHAEQWKVTVVDTGYNTMTGGRVKRIQKYIGNEDFMLTYGDGVSDVNIKELLEFHRKSGKLSTMTAVQPGGRFGTLDIQTDNTISRFAEKTKEAGGWINAGYMILNPHVFDLIDGDDTTLEQYPLQQLSSEGQLAAYKHEGFWQPMDTLKEKNDLELLWNSGKAPWKVWADD
ncbi:MAG: glucose-1-phosphate cytidylyltransferase [Streptococcaceae bacterium]|nr:glucose-1-phosphate cytidylyltransferase [Streptococcaceae bacterium]